MKSEEWIIGAGVATMLGLGVITVFAEDLWEDEYHDAPAIAAGTVPPHHDGREQIACASCHVVLAQGSMSVPVPPPPIFADTPSPHADGRNNMACKNCHKIIRR